jgi:competence protein ComEA
MKKMNGRELARLYCHYGRAVRLAVMVVIVVLCGFLYSCGGTGKKVSAQGLSLESGQSAAQKMPDGTGTGEEASLGSAEPDGIYVYVCGCVNVPGVYEVPAGSRVYQLVELAGGLTDDASQRSLDMAVAVADGQTIYVPSEAEAEEGLYTQASSTDAGTGGRVNINTATKQQLMELSGIGESRAESIISYREKNGAFSSIEDIMNVSGIKEAAYERIKDDICVR